MLVVSAVRASDKGPNDPFAEFLAATGRECEAIPLLEASCGGCRGCELDGVFLAMDTKLTAVQSSNDSPLYSLP